MSVWYQFTQFRLPSSLQGACTSSACAYPLLKDALVKYVLDIGVYHTPCAPLGAPTGCPLCNSAHELPYDGGCLL